MKRLPAPSLPPWIFSPGGALLRATVALALCVPLIGSMNVRAHEAAPGSSVLRVLGLTELRIVVTDEGSDVPAEVAAGRLLLVLENRGTPDGPASVSDVNVLQMPEGVTLDEWNGLMATEGAALPDWFGDIHSAGGFNVAAGETGYAVLDLQPGEWLIGVGDGNPYTILNVTSEGAATAVSTSDPPADISIDLHEFSLDLPGQIPAGLLVWHGINTGEQQHEVVLIKTPELLTLDQVVTILGLPEGGTPPPGVPDPAAFEFLPSGLKTMSPGREIWVEIDLEAGNYVAICFPIDPETGQSHALLGEVDIFTVGDQATPAA